MEHNTKEILANAQLPQGELCYYERPPNPKFTLTPAELDAIMPEYLPGKTMRLRIRKSWTSISYLARIQTFILPLKYDNLSLIGLGTRLGYCTA